MRDDDTSTLLPASASAPTASGATPPSDRALGDRALADRALGAYLGYAIGDALGATVTAMTPGEIVLKYGTHKRMIGGGWLGLKPGHVTDDTEMTLCVGRALVATNGWHLRGACEELARWLKGAPIDVGHTCRRGIRRFLIEGTVQAIESPAHAEAGACTRNLPVALATLGNPRTLARWTREQCHITHNHPLADDATIGLGSMVHALVGGGGVGAAAALARALVREQPMLAFTNFRGPCTTDLVDVIRTVLHHYFRAGSVQECIVATVNAGGEADTAGALAGMLAGATFGASAIPKDWLKRLDPAVAGEICAQVPALLAIAREAPLQPVTC